MPHSFPLGGHVGLYTDYYELVMAQGYFMEGRAGVRASFEYFFRKNPFDGGYTIFAGLDNALSLLQEFRFNADDRSFLRSLGFHQDFLDYLAGFTFTGTVDACEEGEVVFPQEPIIRVEGTIIETQLVETLLLNILNFESLIATKASRCGRVAAGRSIVEFGLRRSQGFAGVHASRAACIGGAIATSNVLASLLYGVPVSGTQAHSWVQSYDDELASFRAYAEAYPERCVLLVDTYDTLRTGVPNAITVAREMRARGQELWGVRLDSGDLAYLSKKTRQMLDAAGLQQVKIVVSNRLDEYIIKSLMEQGAPIDVFGIGTALATGHPDSALDGVYKLCAVDGKPKMKVSENPEKMSLPGVKQVFRCLNGDGKFVADGVALLDERRLGMIHHPVRPELKSDMGQMEQEPLHRRVMEHGDPVQSRKSVNEIREYMLSRLARLPDEHQRFENPHVYRVGITEKLLRLQREMLQEFKGWRGEGVA